MWVGKMVILLLFLPTRAIGCGRSLQDLYFSRLVGASTKAAGVSHDSPRAQTCTIGPDLQKHHQNSTRRPPERKRKRANMGAGEGKKTRNFGRSTGGGSGGGAEGVLGRKSRNKNQKKYLKHFDIAQKSQKKKQIKNTSKNQKERKI